MSCGCQHAKNPTGPFAARHTDAPEMNRIKAGRRNFLPVVPDDVVVAERHVDAGEQWRMMATKAYKNSSDLAVIATREAIQNGVDAIRALARFAAFMRLDTLQEAAQLLQREQDEAVAAATFTDDRGRTWTGRDAAARAIQTAVNKKLRDIPSFIGKNEQRFRKAVLSGTAPKRTTAYAGQGVFGVTYDRQTRTLTWEDNGIGMDDSLLRDKFLTLGRSGKSGDGESAGGFGVAKAVILGISDSDTWELQTRDLYGHPDESGNIPIYTANRPRQGTILITRSVNAKYTMDNNRGLIQARYDAALDTRIRTMLAACDLPDIVLKYNGEVVEPFFKHGGGNIIEKFTHLYWGPTTITLPDGTEGPGIEVRVRGLGRGAGAGRGAIYVRVQGQLQFTRYLGVGDGLAKRDVVIDVDPGRVSPKNDDYPFTQARDDWNDNARAASSFQEIINDLSEVRASMRRMEENEFAYTDFEDDDDHGRSSGSMGELGREAAAVLATPEVREALGELMGHGSAMYDADAKADAAKPLTPKQKRALTGKDIESAAPSAPAATSSTAPVTQRGHGQTKQEAVDVLRELVDGRSPDGWEAGNTLNAVEAGGTLQDYAIDAIVHAAESGIAKGIEQADGGGLVQAVVRAAQVQEALKTLAPKAKPRVINPYGRAFSIVVSKPNYSGQTAAAFKRNIAQHIPKLILWDITLRLIIREAKISTVSTITSAKKEAAERELAEARRKGESTWALQQEVEKWTMESTRVSFKPGFILDRTVRGMEQSRGGFAYVYMNPDLFDNVVKAQAKRPHAIAGYLHNIACHELAHMGGGREHDETWAIEREDLAATTCHLIPAIEEAVVQVLRLKRKPTAVEKKLDGCEDKLLSLTDAQKRLKGELRMVQGGKVRETEELLANTRAALAVANQRADAFMKLAELQKYMLTPAGMRASGNVGKTAEAVIHWMTEHQDMLLANIINGKLAVG